jgi:hypothetical protein
MADPESRNWSPEEWRKHLADVDDMADEELREAAGSNSFEKVGRVGSWAPGDYQRSCISCGGEFIGDKRAQQCLPCAVVQLRGRVEDQKASEPLRIEALRAASRIVAGGMSVGTEPKEGDATVNEFTISLAEQFAKWLETGER